MPEVAIRPATPANRQAVASIHEAAFGGDLESRLVNLLVDHAQATVALVAIVADEPVGHILFSPATSEASGSVGLGLAPLGVLPAFQRQGIGSALVWAGLAACRQRGSSWVVVLGDPAYYGRFGFEPAAKYGLTGEFGGGEAFQICRLDPQAEVRGLVKYAPEFQVVCGDEAH